MKSLQPICNKNLIQSKSINLVLYIASLLFILILSTTLSLFCHVFGEQLVSLISTSSEQNNMKIDLSSSQTVKGITGQFIKIEGKIINQNELYRSNETNTGGIAYISIVDIENKIPVDLEDWSAEKGLYIPFVSSGESLPLEWNVRLVKAGSYTISILFNRDDDISSPPVTSSKISLEVVPKHNLNPGNVLPIAFGVPVALMGIFGAMSYVRGKKTGIYR